MNNIKKYIIVKRLALDYKGKSLTSEKLKKLPLSESAFYTHSGKISGIELNYDQINKAYEDCEKINKFNPSGYYAIAILQE